MRTPTAVGVNVTPMVQLRPAPKLAPQVLLATAKSPVAIAGETLREILRWFVSVTACAPIVVPTGRLANVRLAGETVTDAGVNVICANAHEPEMSTESKRTVPPRNRLVPYFAGLKL